MDVVEQEQSPVLPDPGAGACGHEVMSASFSWILHFWYFLFTLKEFLPEPPSHYVPGRVSTPQAVATAAASPRAHLTLSPLWKCWVPVHGFLFLLVWGEESLHALSPCVLAGAAIKSSMEEIDLVLFFHAGCQYANEFNTGNGHVLLQHNKDNIDKWKYRV